jgi:hypothetical protein
MGPIWAQYGPKMGPVPIWAHNGPNLGPKWAQSQYRPNMGPIWAQNGPKNWERTRPGGGGGANPRSQNIYIYIYIYGSCVVGVACGGCVLGCSGYLYTQKLRFDDRLSEDKNKTSFSSYPSQHGPFYPQEWKLCIYIYIYTYMFLVLWAWLAVVVLGHSTHLFHSNPQAPILIRLCGMT